MGFYKDYPNRKDRRKKSKRVARSCENNGGCPYCEGNRLYQDRRRRAAQDQELKNYNNEC